MDFLLTQSALFAIILANECNNFVTIYKLLHCWHEKSRKDYEETLLIIIGRENTWECIMP